MVDFVCDKVDRLLIIKMLKREEEIRYSKEIQDVYYADYLDSISNPNYIRKEIERDVQKKVLNEFGFKSDILSLRQYWRIRSLYENDKEVMDSIFYLKLNIFEYEPVKEGDDMVDVSILREDGSSVYLSELQSSGKMCLILAGSMTWPPFRQSMSAYQSFYDEFKDFMDIYLLYILEAHFVEKDVSGNMVGGWPIGYQYNYGQPKTLDERMSMVSLLKTEYDPTIPILVDGMGNDFQNVYKPWPDRAYVFLDGKVVFHSVVNVDGTRDKPWTDYVRDWLMSRF